MEEIVSLKEIFNILKKHFSMILISMFAGLAIAGVITFFVMSPQYSSRAQMIVAQPKSDNPDQNLNDVNYNLQMLNTYKDIIKQGDSLALTVQKRLSSEYNLSLSTTEIKNSIEVEQSENSQMFSIVAIGNSSANAEHLANMTAEVFQQTVKNVLTNVDKITIVSRANANLKPVSPNNKLNILIGLFVGLLVGIGLSFLIEFFDRTVKDTNYVTGTLNLIVLGSVSRMSAKELADTTQKLPQKAIKIGKLDSNEALTPRRSRKKI